jgi:uncharacterized protein (TIGR02611 family)
MTIRELAGRWRTAIGPVARVILRSGRRIAVTVLGGCLVLLGLVMTVTPGPGLLVIAAGLAVLATEYVWAERVLTIAKEKARRGAEVAKSKAHFRERHGSTPPDPPASTGPDANRSSAS